MEPRDRLEFEPWPALYPRLSWDVGEVFCLWIAPPKRWVYWERKEAVLAEIWQLQALEEL
jgi:hypothetical protein